MSGFTVRAYRPSNLNKNKSLRKRAEDKRTRGVSRLSAMDPILVKGLREAKQLCVLRVLQQWPCMRPFRSGHTWHCFSPLSEKGTSRCYHNKGDLCVQRQAERATLQLHCHSANLYCHSHDSNRSRDASQFERISDVSQHLNAWSTLEESCKIPGGGQIQSQFPGQEKLMYLHKLMFKVPKV